MIACAMSLNMVMAHPVDVNKAKTLGQKFLDAPLTLAYTAYAHRGDACYYVFNNENVGFIILSADDFYRPVIGYSDKGSFDVNNVPPALADYLEGIRMYRSDRSDLSSAAPDVAADWLMLEKTGRLVSRHGGKGVDYLVQTQWNQSYPYNYFCPEDPAGSHGHTYVGCLATAMAQLMAFWKYPEHGNGSHCYIHEDYGEICADFQNTYYDWEHMANKIDENSPIEEIEAVALISFHCGVTIDMGYGPDGSGGASAPIPGVMHNYFNYSDANVQRSRNDFETEIWKSMVREQFDMGWPMYYGGCEDDGCHAFVCDGYDDYDMFHFNLGWGGGSDGWYLIDAAPYTHPADAMFNFVPQPVYDATPSAPTAINVTTDSDDTLDATVTWTNPTTCLDGSTISSIDKIVVMRNNRVVYETTDNIMPGQQMSCVDHVPYYDTYSYQVYAVSGERNGKQAIFRDAQFGPTCEWKFVLNTTSFNGWNGNYISVYNTAGTEIAQVTLSSSTPVVVHENIPLGRASFGWNTADVANVSFTIKDSQGNVVYEFSGQSDELAEGIFLEANNGCGNDAPTSHVNDLASDVNGYNVTLSWTGINEEGYGYNIYRDGHIIALTQDTQYIDEVQAMGGHCYQVAFLGFGGESELSNESCCTVGDGCDEPRFLGVEIQDNGKPILTWVAAENMTNDDGYYIYRRTNDDAYKRIKVLGPDQTEYKETKQLEYGNWYYYKVCAYHTEIDCMSAPAQHVNTGEFFIKIYYSPASVDENMDQTIAVYPNPANDVVTIKADDISDVEVFNTIGQKVYEQALDADETTINTSDFDPGIYLLRIVANGNEVTTRISVVK